MGSEPAVVDTSNEIARGQSTLQELLTYVLTFSMCVTGTGRILGRYEDISFQCFKLT